MLFWKLRQLKSGNWKTRQEAAKKLGASRNSRAVEPLVEALKDRDNGLRKAAAEALGQIGDARAIEPLVVALKDPLLFVRNAAAQALESLGWQPIDDTQRALWAIAIAGHSYSHKEELVSLGAVAVEPLVEALYSSHSTWMVKALGEIGDVRAVEPILEVLKDDSRRKSADFPAAAAKALGQIGDPRAVDVLIEMISLVCMQPGPGHGGDKNKVVAAAEALGKIGDARAVEDILAAHQDLRREVKTAAAQALVDIGERDVQPLVASLKSKGSPKPAVVEKLRMQCAASRRPSRIELRNRMRKSAAEVLGKIGDVRAVEPLVATFKDEDEDSSVRKAAVQALFAMLRHHYSQYREQALEALDQIDPNWREWEAANNAVPETVRALKYGRESNVREGAAWALEQIGDAQAVEPLVAALKDQHPSVRAAAEEALRQIDPNRQAG